jgi:hypothetical protein
VAVELLQALRGTRGSHHQYCVRHVWIWLQLWGVVRHEWLRKPVECEVCSASMVKPCMPGCCGS